MPPPPDPEELAKREADRRVKEELERKRQEELARARQVAQAWTAHKSEDGQVYYYNSITQESTWQQPPEYRGNANKVADQPIPVSTTQVPDTEWQEVKCRDGRVYYYHEERDETSWTVPDEVAEIKRRQKEEEVRKAAEAREVARAEARDRMEAFRHHPPPFLHPLHHARPLRMFPNRPLLPVPRPTAPPQGRDYAIRKYKELMLDVGVTPFSRWDKILPKMETDPRWSLIPALKDKRIIFDEFCKNIAAEQKKLKEERERAAIQGFKDLLEEAVQFERQLMVQMLEEEEQEKEEEEEEEEMKEGIDEQEEVDEEKEKMEDKDIVETGKNEEELKSTMEEAADPKVGKKDEKVAAVKGTDNGVEEAPTKKVPKLAPIDPSSLSEDQLDLSLEKLGQFWSNDERWEEVTEEQRKLLFEERFGAVVQLAAGRREEARQQQEAAFQQLMREKKVSSTSSWTATHLLLSSDPRYQVMDSQHCESLFRAYVAQLREKEEELTRARQQERDKERELQRKVKEQGEEAERRRSRAAHADASSNYQTLLSEVVRDPDMSWRDVWPRLKKDPQGRATASELTEAECEVMFQQHLHQLLEKTVTALLELFKEKLSPLAPGAVPGPRAEAAQELTVIEAAEKLLEDDPRWSRASEYQRHRVWRRYCEDLLMGRPDPGASALPEASGPVMVEGDNRGAEGADMQGRRRAPPETDRSVRTVDEGRRRRSGGHEDEGTRYEEVPRRRGDHGGDDRHVSGRGQYDRDDHRGRYEGSSYRGEERERHYGRYNEDRDGYYEGSGRDRDGGRYASDRRDDHRDRDHRHRRSTDDRRKDSRDGGREYVEEDRHYKRSRY